MVTGLKRLPEADRARIHAAIAEVEARTHCHFALAVVPVSNRYLLFPLLWGALAALVVGGGLALGWPTLELRQAFAVEAAIFLVVSLLLDWLPLRLAVVPRKYKHAQARMLAHREFAARILADRDHRPGMVFFVSIGERYVEIVAERRLHEAGGDAAWQQIVADFVAAVRSGGIGDGFVTAITACGNILEKHAPRT